MPTPHNSAQATDFAPAVLMPGDPRRAERMAQLILDDARLVNPVRGINGFTGTHKGRPLSVMASGMGMASITIYATELFRFYGVERIIRVGTAGGISPKVGIGDVVVATGAHTTSSMNELRIPGIHYSAVADFGLASAAVTAGGGLDKVFAGPVVSEDHFYFKVPGQLEALEANGVLAVEMEAAALYAVAAAEGKAALGVMTISDHLTKPSQDMTAEERETLFVKALDLAIAAALS